MLLTLHIDQLAPASYRAVLTHGGVEISEAETLHSSIAEAILETARWIPRDLGQFVEPRFGGVTCGTLKVSEAATRSVAEEAASRIIAIVAAVQFATEGEDTL